MHTAMCRVCWTRCLFFFLCLNQGTPCLRPSVRCGACSFMYSCPQDLSHQGNSLRIVLLETKTFPVSSPHPPTPPPRSFFQYLLVFQYFFSDEGNGFNLSFQPWKSLLLACSSLPGQWLLCKRKPLKLLVANLAFFSASREDWKGRH